LEPVSTGSAPDQHTDRGQQRVAQLDRLLGLAVDGDDELRAEAARETGSVLRAEDVAVPEREQRDVRAQLVSGFRMRATVAGEQ